MQVLAPVNERPQLPWWFLPGFYAFIVVSIAISPGPFRTAFTLPIAVLFTVNYGRYGFGGTFGENYPVGAFVALGSMKYVDFALLSHADRDAIRPRGQLRALEKPDAEGDLGGTVTHTFPERLVWSAKIIFLYPRGYGWTHQVQNIPAAKPAGYPKWKFVLQQVLRAAVAILVIDTAKSFVMGTQAGAVVGTARQPLGYYLEPLPRRLAINFCTVWLIWAPFALQASVVYAATVALGIYKPEDCPPVWGPWSEMYTVRKLWSVTWHQLLRRTTTTAGKLVARDMLHLKKGTFASKYTQLFAGFFASALIHWGAAIFACGHDTGDLLFYMLQPAMILAEDHAIAAGRRMGLKDDALWRIVGYAWTWAWLVVSFTWWAGPQYVEGLGVYPQTLDVFGLIQPGAAGTGVCPAAGNSSLVKAFPEL